MPPKLPRISGEDAIRVLKRLGFMPVRQRGSHVILQKQSSRGVITCVVPLHNELAVGTLRGVLLQAKVTPEDFINNM